MLISLTLFNYCNHYFSVINHFHMSLNLFLLQHLKISSLRLFNSQLVNSYLMMNIFFFQAKVTSTAEDSRSRRFLKNLPIICGVRPLPLRFPTTTTGLFAWKKIIYDRRTSRSIYIYIYREREREELYIINWITMTQTLDSYFDLIKWSHPL